MFDTNTPKTAEIFLLSIQIISCKQYTLIIHEIRGEKMSHKYLIGVIIITGMIHLATLNTDSTLLHWFFKLIPMLLIITLAVTSSSVQKYKRLIVIGLVFCILGDTFLLLSDNWFIYGLGSFLIGHVLYIVAMTTRLRFSILTLLAVIPIGMYGFIMGGKIHGQIINSSDNGMWIPMLIYLIVISTMLQTAIMSRNVSAAIGALFFVISDSILAWNKFVSPLSASSEWIMATYFTAQLLIALSITKGLKNDQQRFLL